MTEAKHTPDHAALAAEAAALEVAIGQLGTPAAGARSRAELERRVLQLCTAAQALPGPQARALADPLARLIAALDAVADRLRAAGGGPGVSGSGDSGPDTGAARRAAAAYGSAAGRRRRGF